ncbi:AP-1 complex subunit beta-1, partial [Coemansia sp. RSA 2599]
PLQQQQQQQIAPGIPSTTAATPSSASNSAALKKDVDDLAAQMYNTGFVNSYTSTTTTNYSLTSGSTGAAAPYVPSQKVLLDAQQSQGLEILGTFARRNGQIQMEMSFSNKSGIPIGDFAIQFNKNTFGLMPGSSLNVGTLAPMGYGDVILPLTLGGPSMPMQPLTNIQIAIKSTAGVFYFQTQYSLHILLDETGQCDQGTFLRMWKTVPENMQSSHTAHNLRFASMEDMRNKLNMNSVFTVAQRSVGNATHFYTSSKMFDGTLFYSEIKVANNFQAAIIVTKSSNTQLIPLYQKAIEDICTAF